MIDARQRRKQPLRSVRWTSSQPADIAGSVGVCGFHAMQTYEVYWKPSRKFGPCDGKDVEENNRMEQTIGKARKEIESLLETRWPGFSPCDEDPRCCWSSPAR